MPVFILSLFKTETMKTLYIVRHAKSSWDDLSASDHDRKLLPLGKKRTKIVAKWLKKHNVLPDKIMSSTAVRAYETARLIANGLGFPEEKIEKERRLYGADPEDVEELLFTLPDSVGKVMVVGHNPGFTDLANLFLKDNQGIDNLPTSGVVSVIFDTEKWEEVPLASYHVDFIITPKIVRGKNSDI